MPSSDCSGLSTLTKHIHTNAVAVSSDADLSSQRPPVVYDSSFPTLRRMKSSRAMTRKVRITSSESDLVRMTTASLWLNMTYERYICPDKTKHEPPTLRDPNPNTHDDEVRAGMDTNTVRHPQYVQHHVLRVRAMPREPRVPTARPRHAVESVNSHSVIASGRPMRALDRLGIDSQNSANTTLSAHSVSTAHNSQLTTDAGAGRASNKRRHAVCHTGEEGAEKG
ncbi:hypothetical protein HETIRDRAFT_106706 [Heterobasidion irregulare TC 32-1]|uniref:Uncharacterized protein n=1 Tax=Heterobasidion irregulare (strain TC 32-1) TaxID=747525 RepID=W4JSN3_HETIT|nr:uncharacterized protein HETIRDRAFT_106706 [Heterobasidion irregulare TC 32-1]ETW76120.1 hypothetical protein HETIRDRAFT_106706 [Heterobasidion irregulare TC 32-1]